MRDFEAVFAGDPQTVSEARALVREALADLPADLRGDALTCVSELATNALLHTASGDKGGKYTVRTQVGDDGRVLVEVTDEGTADSAPWVPPAGSECGRGLRIVTALGTVRVARAGTGPGRRVQVLLPAPFPTSSSPEGSR
ncbi:Anti-sigma regulatory factor (Ser/Thr protein kinase) [Thermomonospora echinospora]|uniref:Anti-sigma regulatory factor (Ser/Thr protein kinase) n=1 Tax=Thermomonospora echinospora TaxID=1992 RepID=A0A1H6ED96_9ACTN|nr:ATP-binding protein [Thermomonospora echinospora]SEG94979.1 Anti-sigma regulatory factor (Ser/Thr protein kinase) [Thermomonospora echinospora]